MHYDYQEFLKKNIMILMSSTSITMPGENIGEYISLERRESKCTGKEGIITENLRDLGIETVHEHNKKARVKTEKYQYILMDRAHILNVQRVFCFFCCCLSLVLFLKINT